MTAVARPPTADDLAAIGEAILRELPEPFRAVVADLPIRVTDWADDATLDAMGIEDPLDLTAPPSEPEMIHLYRLPILFEWCERGCTLEEVVFDVLTHEIGHHFGMDETAVLRMEDRDEG